MNFLHPLLPVALAFAPVLPAAAQIPGSPSANATPSAGDLEAAQQAAAEAEAARAAARAERLEELRSAELDAAEQRPSDPADASAALDQALEAFGRGEPFLAEWTLDRGLDQLSTSPGEQREANRALLEFARGALLAEHTADWLQELDPESTDPLDVEIALEREEQAAEAFELALALGGNTEIGRRAAYDLGALRCRMSERLFRGVLTQVMLNSDGESPASFPEDSPERAALEVAAAGFREARESLIGRLLVDSAHADTRANLEWAQRRLREIERLLETEPPEDQEEQSQDQDPSEDDQEESEDSESEDPEPDDSESEDSEQEDTDSEDPEEQEPSEEQENQESESEEQQEEAAPPEGDTTEPEHEPAPNPEESGESPDQQATEVEEAEMSQEEMARLLDKLAEIEAAREALREELFRSRRVPVERDW